MPKSTANNHKRWTAAEVKSLAQLARGNTPTGVIGLKLQRSSEAISSQASKLGISLKPTNKPPYGTTKK